MPVRKTGKLKSPKFGSKKSGGKPKKLDAFEFEDDFSSSDDDDGGNRSSSDSKQRSSSRVFQNIDDELEGSTFEDNLMQKTGLKSSGKVKKWKVSRQKARQALKESVSTWSSKNDDTHRVLAFLDIMKLIRARPDFHDSIVKKMYVAYAQNTKLINVETLPVISFMQKSFAEVCGANLDNTYRHAFIYIRQMAIHLRNAMIQKKKELVSAVLNWQFVQCLYLWARVLAKFVDHELLQQLVYPLVQVTIGCARLMPSVKHFPLRFHCAKVLLIIAQIPATYVPVLPLLTEALDRVEFWNKKPVIQKASKAYNIDCSLKLRKSQLTEKATKEACMDRLQELLLETMQCHLNSVAFSDLVFPVLTKLKLFCKECKVNVHTRQIKAIAEKIEEQSNYVALFLRKRAVNLKAQTSLIAVEAELRVSESPLKAYLDNWKKTKAKQAEIAAETNYDDSDSDSSADMPVKAAPKRKSESSSKKPAKKQKRQKDIQVPEGADVVQDLELSDDDNDDE